MKIPVYRTAIGQDSHRFVDSPRNSKEAERFAKEPQDKKLILGGYCIEDAVPLAGNSDADVILHAICNAISGITGVIILGNIADELCKQGIVNSDAYLKRALETLGSTELVHLSISIEAYRPKLLKHFPNIKARLSELLNLDSKFIGITATTGEGLSGQGRGEGIFCTCVLTVRDWA